MTQEPPASATRVRGATDGEYGRSNLFSTHLSLERSQESDADSDIVMPRAQGPRHAVVHRHRVARVVRRSESRARLSARVRRLRCTAIRNVQLEGSSCIVPATRTMYEQIRHQYFTFTIVPVLYFALCHMILDRTQYNTVGTRALPKKTPVGPVDLHVGTTV